MNEQKLSEDKVLVALVVIFLVAIIGFNLDKFTGNLTLQENKDIPIVTVYPSEVKAGEKIYVNVQIRGACVDPTIEFFFSGIKYDGTISRPSFSLGDITKAGRYKFCKGDYGLDIDNSFTVSYQTRPDWDGDYYARVYYWKDRTTKDYLHSYFRMRPNK
ncbi:MAG: hypothetical protein KKG75_02685 [Nanoarchaeota archaeon]|nr:hypothetical protein [Nanoarchaeota archaeon]